MLNYINNKNNRIIYIPNIKFIYANNKKKRPIFLEYLSLAKQAIKCLDSPPPHIQYALKTDPLYTGRLIGTGILEKRFGKPYYPWQPFIMERLICAFAYLKETNGQSSLEG